MRLIKRIEVLRLILREEPISQAQIARRLQLGRPTVSAVIAELKSRGLVVEKTVGRSSMRGGKPPSLLGVDEAGPHVLALWLEGNRLTCTLLTLRGTVVAQEQRRLPSDVSPDQIAEALGQAVVDMRLRLEGNARPGRVIGVGVALSGRIDPHDGRVLFSLNYGMRDFPLGQRVRDRTRLPVYVADYPVACALHESWCGAAMGRRHFVFLRILPFLKAIVTINGEIYYGADTAAGEIGGSLARMGFDTPEVLCDLIDHDLFGTPEIAAKMDRLHGLRRQPPFNLDLVETVIESIEHQKIADKMIALAHLVSQIIWNLLLYYNPELIILDGVPREWQDAFLDRVIQMRDRQGEMGLSTACTFAFTERAAGYQAQAVLSMVIERMLVWDGMDIGRQQGM